jgi:DNA-binding HxlR family transcriptional regulator
MTAPSLEPCSKPKNWPVVKLLVSRTAHYEKPPRVEYDLTPTGESLNLPLHTLSEWAT